MWRSWSDIFYPDNPKRREELIRKNQELEDLMKSNFRATNQLIDTMNKYLCCSFEHIAMDKHATLQENCNVMIECIHKIQDEVEKIDKELKEMLEPTLYEKLLNMSLSTTDFQLVSKVFEGVCGVASVGTITLVGSLIDKGIILTKMTTVTSTLGKLTIASVGLGVVFLGIDMIVEAILGSIERDQLNKALEEYDQALDEFRPASDEFQDHITYVRIKIEIMEKEKMHV